MKRSLVEFELGGARNLFFEIERLGATPPFRSAHRSDVKVTSHSGTRKFWLGREPLYKGMRHDSM